MEQSQLEKDVLKLDTYVALHSFSAQESHDLEMRLVYMHLHTHISLMKKSHYNTCCPGLFPQRSPDRKLLICSSYCS